MLYLFGRALCYAMAHGIKVDTIIPLQLFRKFIFNNFLYSKQTIEYARYDLAQQNVDVMQIHEFEVNGITYTRAELNDDELFTVMYANYFLFGRFNEQVEAIVSGFDDFGGLNKQLAGLNAVQLKKLISE